MNPFFEKLISLLSFSTFLFSGCCMAYIANLSKQYREIIKRHNEEVLQLDTVESTIDKHSKLLELMLDYIKEDVDFAKREETHNKKMLQAINKSIDIEKKLVAELREWVKEDREAKGVN